MVPGDLVISSEINPVNMILWFSLVLRSELDLTRAEVLPRENKRW